MAGAAWAMIDIAVVIPTFNRAHQIEATIQSVLDQSVPPAEIVVVDDGSTDDTESVVARFGARVSYVRQANAGVSAARNHGVALTKAPLVAFVDSDDLWASHKLAVQLTALEAADSAGWSITGCDVIDPHGQVIPGRRGFPAVFGVFHQLGMSPEELFSRYLSSITVSAPGGKYRGFVGDAYLPLFLGNFALPSSALVRRDVFERVGGFDSNLRLAEETEFFHRLAAASPVVLLLDPLVGYRVGQAGSLISPANTTRLIANALVSLDSAARLRAETRESRDHVRRGRQALFRKLAYANLTQQDGTAARAAVREIWRTGGAQWNARVFGLYAASFLPGTALGVLGRVKGVIRRGFTQA